MSKLYWQLRRAMTYKSKVQGSIIIRFRKHKYAPLKMERYPHTKWGYGYWLNKNRR